MYLVVLDAIDSEGVEVDDLKELLLSHESLEWRRPALRKHLQPLRRHLIDGELGQRSSLGRLGLD
jgi:hypothetical protein